MKIRISEKQILTEIIFGLLKRLDLETIIITDEEREKRRWESKYYNGMSLNIVKSKDNDIIVKVEKG